MNDKGILFNLLFQGHGITLLESELEEIISLVANSLHGEVIEIVESFREQPPIVGVKQVINWKIDDIIKALKTGE